MEGAGGTPVAATQDFPVTLEHKFGTTEIPGPAERIVVVGYNDGDFALAFGEVPLGARAPVADYPFLEREWAQEAIGDAEIEVVADGDSINFEQVAALRPTSSSASTRA